mmetsp:Transcript_58829/g.138306  ORF Transcript_58829/g.138306 Transcript_58829/m.138306 type:complete len:298 (-) Transcript_58829:194-1087(-)
MPKLPRCRNRNARGMQTGQTRRSAGATWVVSVSPERRSAVPVSLHVLEGETEQPAERPANVEHEASDPSSQSGSTNEQLARGCVLGISVPLGQPVFVVPDENHMDLAVRSSIEGDNYKFLRYILTTEWASSMPTTCSFSVTVNRSNLPEEIVVTHASLLHYAICCGSLHAAAALIVAFPEQALETCQVEIGVGEGSSVLTWTALDFAWLLCNLYKAIDPQKRTAYDQAFATLLNLHKCIPEVSFMLEETPRERLLAAGDNPRTVVKALTEAAMNCPQEEGAWRAMVSLELSPFRDLL